MVTPPRLKPGAQTGGSNVRLLSIAGLSVLVVVALGVVFVLPNRVADPGNQTATGEPPVVPKSAAKETPPDSRPVAPATSGKPGKRTSRTPAPAPEKIRERADAEALMSEVLDKQAQLESDGVREWGNYRLVTSYPDATSILTKANENFDAGRYAASADGFRNTLVLFKQLESGKEKRYRQAILVGTGALEGEDPKQAEKAFELALTIKPDDPFATRGLYRARNLPRMLALMASARKAATDGKLDGALTTVKQVYKIDPEFQPAIVEAVRLRKLIDDRNFTVAISGALKFIEEGKFKAVDDALRYAKTIRPMAPEISDLRKRLRQKRQIAWITTLKNRARRHEKAEDWQQAAVQYDKILAIDPSVALAIDGKEKSTKLIKLYDQIDRYLNNPERLGSTQSLAHAKNLVATAQGLSGAGERLLANSDLLSAMIVVAEKPRPVVIRSDGETKITVYRVARLGSLSERKIALRPGRYVAVGTRPGFRDVRVEFRVPASDEETVVLIQCSERI